MINWMIHFMIHCIFKNYLKSQTFKCNSFFCDCNSSRPTGACLELTISFHISFSIDGVWWWLAPNVNGALLSPAGRGIERENKNINCGKNTSTNKTHPTYSITVHFRMHPYTGSEACEIEHSPIRFIARPRLWNHEYPKNYNLHSQWFQFSQTSTQLVLYSLQPLK